MTPIKRPLALASAAVLLGLSLSACGGAPSDASVEDFCKAQNDSAKGEELFKAFGEKDWDKAEDLLKEQADEVEEVGTPEDIPDDAREGFEIQIDAVKDISADDIQKAVEDQNDPFEETVSDDDTDKVEAFEKYESETCSEESGSDDSDSGSDSGTTESDTSTELPSDLGTELP